MLKYSVNKITYATHIDKEMTNNQNFLDPPPALDLIRKLLPIYVGAVADAKTRDKVAISLKKDLKGQMVGHLTELDASNMVYSPIKSCIIQ